MKKFTKSEATQIVQNMVFGVTDTGQAERWVEAFEALGLVELKEEKEEEPIFELKYPSGAHSYKIWANGRIEGFNDGIVVINRIPELIAKLKQNNS